MSLGFFKSCVLVLLSAVTFAVLSSPARGQAGVSQTCAQLGFKPGTKGHTDCVNQNSGVGGRVAPKPANPAPAAKAPVVPVITAEQREDKFWDAAMAAGNKDGFEAYLERYPSGRYVSMANANIARLTPPQVVAPPKVALAQTWSDPHAYCSAVNTIDKPDARYLGPKEPPNLRKILHVTDQTLGLIEWRCMDGNMYACYSPNGPICDKLNTRVTAAIRDFCGEYPNSETIPTTNAGRQPLHWECKGKLPHIKSGDFRVDKRGYSYNWQLIPR